MERSELMSSAASGSYGLTQTENDDTLSEGCSEGTLTLVEDAILRTLRKHSSQTPTPRSHQSKRPRGRLHNARDEEQQSESTPPAKSSNPNDMELLASLLEQVHDLRRKPKETPQETRRPVRRRGREKKSSSSSNEELRMTLEAATMAAKAAADAAEAAAVAVARNTEAIEFIVNSLNPKQSKSKSADDERNAIVKSNRITHWILGFMAVSTIAWRFGVVTVAKSVSSKLTDPLGYVGGLIGNNDDSENEKPREKVADKGNLLDKLPHIDMPEILANSSEHKTSGKGPKAKGNEGKEDKEGKEAKGKETGFFATSAAAVDVKTKQVEKIAFSLADLLHIKPKKT